MNFKKFIIVLLIVAFTVSFYTQEKYNQNKESIKIDKLSYALGSIAAFAEIVDLGIKKLGFSSTFTSTEINAILQEAKKIAEKYDVKLYRENDLIVTDLFPADVALGKEILIIYSGNSIEEYLALKEKKNKYKKMGKYNKTSRREIAYELGKLLSYPDKAIEKLLSEDKLTE